MKKIIKFVGSRQSPRTGDMSDYLFHFLIDNKHPTEIKVSISGPLIDVWFNNDNAGIEAVLFQFAKRHLVEKIKSNNLKPNEKVVLISSTQPRKCPYKPSEVGMKHGDSFEVEIMGKG
jgi:hypothetical protein